VDNPQQIISLCTGYGGIELGLERAGVNVKPIAYVEIEAWSIANLVDKIESGKMAPAPIHSDLKTFPYGRFRSKVDGIIGGYPCQPFSAAGKRLGKDDPRHLWSWIADGIRACQPRWCFFENVEGHITSGLYDVLSDLAGMGYATTWGLFSASEVGAPHLRKRVFILANRNGERLEGLRQCVRPQGWQEQIGYTGSGCQVWPARPGQPQHDWEEPKVKS